MDWVAQWSSKALEARLDLSIISYSDVIDASAKSGNMEKDAERLS